MNKVRIIVVFLVSILVFAQCSDYEPLAWTDNDAFITSQYSNGEIVHGLSFYARSNVKLKSVVVNTPNQDEINMDVFIIAQPYEFVYDTHQAEMTSSLPQAGSYSFTAITQGENEEIVGHDEIVAVTLPPAKIESCSFDSLYSQLQVTWHSVEDASYTIMSILDERGNKVYMTKALAKTDTAKVVSVNDPYWLLTDYNSGATETYKPMGGQRYTVQVATFLKEQRDEKLQARSLATESFIWQDEINIIDID